MLSILFCLLYQSQSIGSTVDTALTSRLPSQLRAEKRWEGRRKATASPCISSPCVRLISTGMYTATDGTTVPCCVSSPQSLSCMCVCSVQPGSPRWVAGSQCCNSPDLLLTPSLNQCRLLYKPHSKPSQAQVSLLSRNSSPFCASSYFKFGD